MGENKEQGRETREERDKRPEEWAKRHRQGQGQGERDRGRGRGRGCDRGRNSQTDRHLKGDR